MLRALEVHASVAGFVAGGGRDVDASRIRGAAPTSGEHVRLVDQSGEEIALAVADFENGYLRVLAVPSDGLPAIDSALLGLRVERALAWRKALGLGGTYRLIHGAGDGLPGFTCDVLGEVAVVYVYGAALRALGLKLAEAVIGFAKLRGAAVKLRARGEADAVAQDVIGEVPETIVSSEAGASYELHPRAGLNVGLFTDMREHRAGLARYASGKRVLNLFSYTGSLGLACARAGATEVTNVDTSAGVQAWAQGNFTRNQQTARFETGDAVRFLARAVRDRERYDLIVIDPPSSSAARGTEWTTGRDYPELIAQAASVIPSGGLLWLAANTYDLGSLAKLASKGLRDAHQTANVVEQGGLPPEYPTSTAQPHDRYLQVCVLRID